MNLAKHCKPTQPRVCDSGSFVDFSGSIALLNQHILRQMGPYFPYDDYLQSSVWQARRDIYLDYYGNVCQICRKTFKRNMTLHHINYKRVAQESLNDVVLVCRNCHYKTHRREQI